jgi:hypothetical protein
MTSWIEGIGTSPRPEKGRRRGRKQGPNYVSDRAERHGRDERRKNKGVDQIRFESEKALRPELPSFNRLEARRCEVYGSGLGDELWPRQVGAGIESWVRNGSNGTWRTGTLAQ